MKLKIKFSEGAQTTLSPLTRIPKRVVGINVFPTALREGVVPLTEKNVEMVFKDFLKENQEFFGVNTEDLKLSTSRKVRGRWYIKFQQYYEGILVYQATVGLDASDRGKVGTYASNYHPKLEVSTYTKDKLGASSTDS